MRALHRWFGLVAAVFMLFLAVTGFVLQVELWIAGKAPPGRTIGPPPTYDALAADNTEALSLMSTGMDGLREAFPNAEVGTISVNLKNGQVSFTGNNLAGGRSTPINGKTGEYKAPPPTPTGLEYIWTRDWHYIMQDLHAGYYFGLPGRIMSLFLALALGMLSITGLQVYLDLFKRRKKIGRKGLFWK